MSRVQQCVEMVDKKNEENNKFTSILNHHSGYSNIPVQKIAWCSAAPAHNKEPMGIHLKWSPCYEQAANNLCEV